MEEVIEHFKGLYPDKMTLDKMDEFDRVKLIGKVELIREIVIFITEEYGSRFEELR